MAPKGSLNGEGGKAITQQQAKSTPALRRNPSSMPDNWPASITYLRAPTYSKFVTEDLLNSLNHVPANAAVVPLSEALLRARVVRITKIERRDHPAFGQYGLAALQNLLPDSLICLYMGHIHMSTPEDTDPTSDYDLSMDRDIGIGVDAAKSGNEARFINDYRGIADAPNAEFRDTWVDYGKGNVVRTMGIWVLTAGKSGKRKKGISRGEEVLVNYGKGFWSERQKEQKQKIPVDVSVRDQS